MSIDVVPYDPGWPARFSRMRAQLEAALAAVPVLGIEHVGSTSVPGLAAKPVIDVDVVVTRHDLRAAIDALAAVGYVHRGDLGVPDRHAMAAPDDGLRRNVYVVIEGSLALRNHLVVRDALRRDPELRRAYASLKQRLASEVVDIGDYVFRKSDLLLGILADAGFTDEELDAVRAANLPVSRPLREPGVP